MTARQTEEMGIRDAALLFLWCNTSGKECSMNILVSACLLGVKCRYDGTGKEMEGLKALMKEYHLIPVCPEVLGGLPTPRMPSEIQPNRRVQMKDGKDVTQQYEKGAREVLKLARLYDCRYAILKERSPSCGHEEIYDGSFTGRKIPGNGIAAELLEKNGVKVFGESQIELLKSRIEEDKS